MRHYQEFLDRRRQARSVDEYKPVTDREWSDFEEHFDRRKVELGGCMRPYGSDCQHEHSCLKCPMLAINPKMLPRLDEIEEDLRARRARAEREVWLGEVEGIDLTPHLPSAETGRDQAAGAHCAGRTRHAGHSTKVTRVQREHQSLPYSASSGQSSRSSGSTSTVNASSVRSVAAISSDLPRTRWHVGQLK